jgi:hypothetical protein
MTNEAILTKLATPKPGHMTSRLPTKFAHTNAALIAHVTKAKEEGAGK